MAGALVMQFDFVSFTTATTGTGTVTVGSATSGFRTLLDAGVPDGTLIHYTIKDGTDKESGSGIVGGSSTTITRVLSQSTTGSLLNLSGTATMFITPIAAQYNLLIDGMDETLPIVDSDDFMNNSGGTGQIGVLGWKFTNGSIYVPSLTQNHPGLIGLRTSATANQVCSFYIGNAVATNVLRFDEWLEARYIFRPTAANTDCAYQIGPMSAYGSLTPTHGVWLERLSTDTNWFFVSSNASTKTRTDSGVAFAAAWFNVKMRRISASSVGFVLNGGAEVTIGTNIPDAADGLNIGLQRAGTTTTTRDVDLDRIAYKSLSIVR